MMAGVALLLTVAVLLWLVIDGLEIDNPTW